MRNHHSSAPAELQPLSPFLPSIHSGSHSQPSEHAQVVSHAQTGAEPPSSILSPPSLTGLSGRSSPSGGRFFWRGAIKDGSPPDVRRELVAASAAGSAFGIRKTGFLQGNRQEYACRKSGVPQHGISTRMGFTEIARLSVLSRNDLSQAVNNLAS